MVHCCVPGCKNTHHHKNKKDEWGGGGQGGQESRNYSLHDLPSEDRVDVRDLWVMAINRTTLPKDVAVCSDHFTEDCFDEKWEEYKRKYGPTKVKRKLKTDAVPTIFPGRIFIHEKVQRIKENWKNKVLQKQLEMEKLRLEREYKDRFKLTQTECTCKCRCKMRRKNFTQQVNFSFKFMEDVGTQFPIDLTQTVKDDHSYGKHKANKAAIVAAGEAVAAATSGAVANESTSTSETSTNTRTTEETKTTTSSTSTDTADIKVGQKRPKTDEIDDSGKKPKRDDGQEESNEEERVDESDDELDLETESDHEETGDKK